jgi:hypothetical protein
LEIVETTVRSQTPVLRPSLWRERPVVGPGWRKALKNDWAIERAKGHTRKVVGMGEVERVNPPISLALLRLPAD